MKINKILAAGVAATLAVTSLSAVASAEVKTREFDMSQSIGAWDSLAVSYKSVYGTQTSTDRAYATETDRAVIDFSVGGIATLYEIVGTGEYALKIERNANNTITGTVTQWAVTKDKGANFDCQGALGTGAIPDKYKDKTLNALWSFDLSDAWWSGAEVTVSGYKFDAKGTKTKVTQTAKAENSNFAPIMSSDPKDNSKLGGGQWDGWYGPSVYRLVVLPDTVLTYKDGTAIAPAYFDEIEDVAVNLTMHDKVLNKTSPAPGMQFTSDEKNFNLMSLLLKNIRIPISDARVSYTNEAGGFVIGGAAVKGGDVDALKDGIELYTNSQPANKALVNGQIDKVKVTPGQAEGDIKITDKVYIASEDGVDVEDKTTITKRYEKVGESITYPNDPTKVDLGDATAGAFGYTATGNPITILDKNGKKVTVYAVTTASTSGDIDVTMWVDTPSLTPYLADKPVNAYDIATAVVLPVYAESDKPDWSGYTKVVTDGVIATGDEFINKDKWIIRDKNGTETVQDTNALWEVTKEIATARATADVVEGGNTAAAVIAYCIAHGGYDPAINIKYVEGPNGTLATTNSTRYAYLQRTTDNATIGRQKVKVLSYTGDHLSKNGGDLGGTDAANQSYKTVEDYNKGDFALQFAGLASQCADFFNGQNNGTITFHFVSPSAAGSSWVNGGVPSTEVGLKSALGSTAMAIFFNYATTTGSLQANGVVDSDAATMTFDITDNLNAMGNHTIATLHDIYYGMNQGVRYSDYPESDGYDVGYLVDKVTLTYDDAPAAVDANTDDDAADDDAAVVVADDDDDDDDVVADDDDDIAEDDDIIEDDDDDDDDAGEIIEDDDDDDDDVNNDVDYVDADDDANPGTGVGLAVIPAIVAGAALVVSKKRK